jgi:hypothetical protein
MALVKADRVKETTTTTGTGTVTLAGAATGYRTFTSVLADQDTCYYCIAGQGTSEWETGLGTFTTSGTTLARTTVLASSNSGNAVNFSAGTKDVFITEIATRFQLPSLTSDPAAPSSGVLMYSRPMGGRHLPHFIGPSGLDSCLQPAMFGNNVTMWLPGVGTTAAINFGTSWTSTTTEAHPAITNTNYMTQMKRATWTTTTTAANGSGVRSASPVCWRGNAAGQGGFFFAARFGILTYQSAMRILVGLSGQTGALGGTDPSSINDTCGMTKDTGETTWQVMTRDTSAASKTSTGRTTAASGTANIFDLYMFCKPNDNQITFRVIDITDGTVLVDNVSKSSNLPTNTVMLTAHAACVNVTGGAGTACAIFTNKLYIESDT